MSMADLYYTNAKLDVLAVIGAIFVENITFKEYSGFSSI